METQFYSIYEMHKELCLRTGRGLLECAPKVGEHGEFVNFCEYYKQHYRPLLEQLAQEKPDTAARFIVQDMDELFLGYLKEWEEDD